MMEFIIYNIPMFHHSKLSLVLCNEAKYRTIIRSLSLRREETAWKLLHPPMISDALATFSLAVTGLISTGASGFVFF
jgi:hypothetical protein